MSSRPTTDPTRGRSAGSAANPLQDPTRGRSAGSAANPLRDPTRDGETETPRDPETQAGIGDDRIGPADSPDSPGIRD